MGFRTHDSRINGLPTFVPFRTVSSLLVTDGSQNAGNTRPSAPDRQVQDGTRWYEK